MDFELTGPEHELVALCRDFAGKEIASRAPLAWEEARCPTDLLREMGQLGLLGICLLYTSPSPRDRQKSRMPSSA